MRLEELKRSQPEEPDITGLPASVQARYNRLKEALAMHWGGAPPREIKRLHGIPRQNLNYYEDRFFSRHADGRIWGYRALITGVRIVPYTRTSESSSKTIGDGWGAAGSFEQCLRIYPAARKAIEEAIKRAPRGPNSRVLNIKEIHKAFLDALRAADVPISQYPFCTATQGIESLRAHVHAYIRSQKNSKSGRILLYGPEANDGLDARTGETGWLKSIHPCSVVCYDEQLLPAIGTVAFDHCGERVVLPMERMSLCLLASTKPRCVLAYHLSLRPRVAASDFLETFNAFLTPWKPRVFTAVPSLSYRKGAGFPNGLVPGFLEGVRIGLLRIDNDLTHYANLVTGYLKPLLGAAIEFGMIRRWISRYAVEGVFSELQRHLSELASTTGSGPQDAHVGDAATQAQKWEITLDELSELVEVIVANLNGLPRDELYGASPIEKVTKEFAGSQKFGPAIPGYGPEIASHLPLPIDLLKVVIRGSEKKGVSPYVELDHATYTSPLLRDCWSHIGTPFIAHLQKDHRTLKLKHEDGREFCTVQVTGHWSESFHDRATRQEIIRLRRLGVIRYTSHDNPVAVFKEHTLKKMADHAKRNPAKVMRGFNKYVGTLSNPDTKPEDSSLGKKARKNTDRVGRWTNARLEAQNGEEK